MFNILNRVHIKNEHEKLFINTTTELFNSLGLKFDESVVTVLLNAQKSYIFSVPWIDRNGKTQVNLGYRVQYNNSLGPYKGGIRFDKSVNLDIMKFLAFEQTFKNALTGLPMGGAKGGSDFSPKDKTESELLNFCQSYINQLYLHIGESQDVPAGDIGVGKKEIGYMVGQYKTLTQQHTGTFTGKDPGIGGLFGRTEATGYGLIYIVEALLKSKNNSLHGKKIVISGSGDVAIHAAFKAVDSGATIIAMSDRSGYVTNLEGLDINRIFEHKSNNESLSSMSNVKFVNNMSIWDIPCDIALPCATQQEIHSSDVKALIDNNCILVAEGSNKPLTSDAVQLIQKSSVLYLPGKAANAGGVAASGIEMSQNAQMTKFSNEYLDKQLYRIMNDIFINISQTANRIGQPDNFLLGANVYAYETLEKSIKNQGVL